MVIVFFSLVAGLNVVLGALVWWQLGRAAAGLSGDPAASCWAARLRWLLPLWYIFAVGAAASPLFQQPWATPAARPALLLGVALPIAAGTLLLTFPTHRRLVDTLPIPWLIGLHGQRAVLGSVFLLMASQGLLPVSFALQAGLGDIIAGLLSLPLALAARRSAGPRTLILIWNTLALADLVNALRLGVTVVLPFLVATQTPGTIAIVPLFGVPIYIVAHAYLFRLLRRSGAARAASGVTA